MSLAVVRMEYSELRDPQVITLHADWHGRYDRGAPIEGECLAYSSNGTMRTHRRIESEPAGLPRRDKPGGSPPIIKI